MTPWAASRELGGKVSFSGFLLNSSSGLLLSSFGRNWARKAQVPAGPSVGKGRCGS